MAEKKMKVLPQTLVLLKTISKEAYRNHNPKINCYSYLNLRRKNKSKLAIISLKAKSCCLSTTSIAQLVVKLITITIKEVSS